MSIRIGQASLGETGGRGQKPGNQTGRELNFSYWYNGNWLGILRFKDGHVGAGGAGLRRRRTEPEHRL